MITPGLDFGTALAEDTRQQWWQTTAPLGAASPWFLDSANAVSSRATADGVADNSGVVVANRWLTNDVMAARTGERIAELVPALRFIRTDLVDNARTLRFNAAYGTNSGELKARKFDVVIDVANQAFVIDRSLIANACATLLDLEGKTGVGRVRRVCIGNDYEKSVKYANPIPAVFREFCTISRGDFADDHTLPLEVALLRPFFAESALRKASSHPRNLAHLNGGVKPDGTIEAQILARHFAAVTSYPLARRVLRVDNQERTLASAVVPFVGSAYLGAVAGVTSWAGLSNFESSRFDTSASKTAGCAVGVVLGSAAFMKWFGTYDPAERYCFRIPALFKDDRDEVISRVGAIDFNDVSSARRASRSYAEAFMGELFVEGLYAKNPSALAQRFVSSARGLRDATTVTSTHLA